jgi:hypothetical protein
MFSQTADDVFLSEQRLPYAYGIILAFGEDFSQVIQG